MGASVASSAYQGMAQGLGDAAAGIMADKQLESTKQQAGQTIGQGTATLTQGLGDANQAYSPYTAAGSQGVGQYATDISQSGGIQGPSTSQPFSFDPNSDPSATYVRDLSNAAIQTGGIAGGNFSSGTVRNMQTNSANLGKTAYNDAYNRYLAGSNQLFGQQQQQYANANQQQQQRIANEGNLAGMGLTATNQNQNLALGYNQGINSNYQDLAGIQSGIGVSQAGNTRRTIEGVTSDFTGGGQGGGMSSGLSNLF